MNRHLALLLAVAALTPAVASAQTAPTDAEARAAFERGMAETTANRYASAVAAFEESYRLRPVAVVLFNLAAAYSRMGRDQLAIATYERYLTEGGDRVAAERVQWVRARIAELRSSLPVVVLQLRPANVAITVDGRPQVVTGGEVTLDPGNHLLVASAPGHAPQQRDLHLAPGTRITWNAQLEPTAVEATPATAPLALRSAVTPHPASEPDAPAASSPGITSRWWFWTGAGLILAGATTAVVLGATGAFTTTEGPVGDTAYDVNTLRLR
ncbi:MAG: hypothetical protein IPF99_22080 [Deltaproteobacteria bacterium]|nr:hypothetical protein [Deltaproteobacteria bacterium]